MDRPNKAQQLDRVIVFIFAKLFLCQVLYCLDHEIMQLPSAGRDLCGHQTSSYERVIIKVSLG
jgi:hypothetical protein